MKSKKLFVDEMGQMNLTGRQPIKHHEPPNSCIFCKWCQPLQTNWKCSKMQVLHDLSSIQFEFNDIKQSLRARDPMCFRAESEYQNAFSHDQKLEVSKC